MERIKNLKCYEKLEINMVEFLHTYCGLTTNNIFKMTHKDVKMLMPDLKRCSTEEVLKVPILLYTGAIILVRDSKKIVVPYYNPLRYSNDEIIDVGEVEEPEKKERKQEKIDIYSMTNYELQEQYRVSKKSQSIGKFKLCRLIKHELSDRGVKGPGKRKRYLENIKGEINND